MPVRPQEQRWNLEDRNEYRRSLPAGLTVCALLFSLFLCGCGEPGPRALLKGERLLREKQFARAVEPLQTATRLLPKNPQAWNHLGVAYHAAGQPEQAQRAYKQALAIDFNLAPARLNLGTLALEQNDVPLALEHLTSYTFLQPTSPEGWIRLANAELRARRFDVAEKHYKTALELRPRDPEALNGLGNIAFYRRKPQEALTHFNNALAEDPRYAPAILNVAVVHHSQNNRQQAVKEYQKYVALAPAGATVDAVNAVIDQLELELAPPTPTPAVVLVPKTNTAAPPSTRAPAVTTPPPAIVTAPVRTNTPAPTPAEPVVKKNEPAVATRTAAPPPVAAAPKPNPQPPRPAPQTNAPAAAATRPAPATNPPVELTRLEDDLVVKPAQDVVTRPATAASAKTNVPVAAPRNTTEARERESFLARLNPFNGRAKATNPPPATSPSGVTAATTTSAERPAASTPSYPRYRYASPAPGKPGNRRAAERYFAQGVKAQNAGQLHQAVSAYQQAADTDPSYFEVFYNLGLAAYELGRWKQSLSSYEAALALKAESLDTRYNFALALKQAGYPIDAAEELKRILQAKPGETRAHLSLANIYAQQLNQPALARPHYQKVVDLDPSHPRASEIRFWLAANP